MKRLAPMAMELLLKRIAMRAKENVSGSNSPYKWAEIYQKIDMRRQNMETLNLSPQLVLETSLMDVISE